MIPAWELTNVRSTVQVHLASKSRCCRCVHSYPHQLPHQYPATFELLQTDPCICHLLQNGVCRHWAYDNPRQTHENSLQTSALLGNTSSPPSPLHLSHTHTFTHRSNNDKSSFCALAVWVWVCLSHSLEAAACLNTHLACQIYICGGSCVRPGHISFSSTQTHTERNTCAHWRSALLAFQVALPHCLHVEHELPLFCCLSRKNLQTSDTPEKQRSACREAWCCKLHRQVWVTLAINL